MPWLPRSRRATWLRLGGGRQPGIAAVLAVGLVAVPVLISVVLNAASWAVPGGASGGGPSDVRIGMTRAEVVEYTGGGDPLTRMAAKTVETPRPAGADCLYSYEWQEDRQKTMIVRYCFREDRLATIDRFPVSGD